MKCNLVVSSPGLILMKCNLVVSSPGLILMKCNLVVSSPGLILMKCNLVVSSPSNMRQWPNVGLMMGQPRRHLNSNVSTLSTYYIKYNSSRM